MKSAASTHATDVGQAFRHSTKSRASRILRWGPVIAGGGLGLLALTRRSRAGIALAAGGGLLAYAGAKAGVTPRHMQARSSVLLNCPPQEAYQFWRNLENLPLFMRHLDSVKQIGDRRSRWTALGPLGSPIRWDAEIVVERENELISWRSLPGSEVEVDGSVEFRNAPANRGTILEAVLLYRSPAGAIGRTVAKMLGKNPDFLMRQDLRRLKALIEAGEIPTTEGQSHGRRSATAAVARAMNPDQPFRRGAKISEVLKAERRVS